MKKIFEIIFMFVICLASFITGWVMSLRYQKKISPEQISSASSKKPDSMESEILQKEPNHLTLGETSLVNLPSSDSPPPSLESVSETANVTEDVNGKKMPSQVISTKEQEAVEDPPLSNPEKKRKDKFDELNREAFNRIKNRQNVFNERGQVSFLINVFSKENEAMEYVQKLRGQFPLWGFFLKPDKQNLRVYLGPFLTKERAADFIKVLPDPKPFPNYFLETEGL